MKLLANPWAIDEATSACTCSQGSSQEVRKGPEKGTKHNQTLSRNLDEFEASSCETVYSVCFRICISSSSPPTIPAALALRRRFSSCVWLKTFASLCNARSSVLLLFLSLLFSVAIVARRVDLPAELLPRFDRLYSSAAPRISAMPQPVLKPSVKFRAVAMVQEANVYVACTSIKMTTRVLVRLLSEVRWSSCWM